jgi:hypothetical protein
VSPEGTTTNPTKLKAVWEWLTPRNKHEIRSFVGLCTYYRQCITGFTNVTKPLAKLTEEKQAFQKVKQALRTASILAYLQPKEVRHWHASNIGIRGVLSQVQDGQEQVIVYYSKMLNKADRNYCVTQWELQAIMRMLEHFHKYLFHLHTDHSALTWLMRFKNLEEQTARWIQHLQEYSFTSEHCQG